MKTIRSVITFYKGFAASGLFITALCLLVYISWKVSPYVIVPLFWFKVACYGIIYYYITHSKRKEFYYYHALGVSKTTLWTSSIFLDFLLYVTAMIVTNKWQHA